MIDWNGSTMDCMRFAKHLLGFFETLRFPHLKSDSNQCIGDTWVAWRKGLSMGRQRIVVESICLAAIAYAQSQIEQSARVPATVFSSRMCRGLQCLAV